MITTRRVILIVLDSVGLGALPDAAAYGDEGSNTLVHTAQAVGGLALPHLGRLGLGNLAVIPGTPSVNNPEGAFGLMREASVGKDTTTGHWEIAGLVLDHPFPTYPEGFPAEVIDAFSRAIGRPVLGNRPASGTQIIAELGAEHLRTGYPIVYTSADSVFQIAAHEEIIPPEELYAMCQVARRLLVGKHGVGRVIARPFVGKEGNFRRTERRRDFALPPSDVTLLDWLIARGVPVWAVGKIEDIFAGRGITQAWHTAGNREGLEVTLDLVERVQEGLIFTNLVDFDMLYGHRNDPQGYAHALEEFDAMVPEIRCRLREEDLLIITADHGCDPTTPSTDHSREQVPLLVTGPAVRGGVELGIRESFRDVGATVALWLTGIPFGRGRSFLDMLR